MPRHEAVRPMTDGQRTDITTTLVQAIPPLSFADADNIGSKKGPFIADIRAVFAKYSLGWMINKKLVEWQKFYRDNFDLKLNFAGLQIPEEREGFDRLLVIAQGVTAEQVFQKCRQLFHAWKYTDSSLDEIVTINDRDASKGHYTVWVRDRVEADEEWKNHSANALTGVSMKGETLLERLIHELKYYRETGKHLDIQNITLCSGSRHSDGGVPFVCWRGGGLSVCCCRVAGAGGGLRSRQVVSTAAAKAAA